ncbi:MAG: hypothetical protein ACMXYD_01800 [Candidatus Woesearchaeota archaeon]
MADDKAPEMSKDERIGFHKGSLSTLSKEQAELARILNIVEQLIQMHTQELKALGVDVSAQQEEMPVIRKDKKPIEDIL